MRGNFVSDKRQYALREKASGSVAKIALARRRVVRALGGAILFALSGSAILTLSTSTAGATTTESSWASLQSAFQNGGTFKLTASITATSGQYLTVNAPFTSTLDLNGHKLTIGTGLSTISTTKAAIVVKGTLVVETTHTPHNGTLTVTGGNYGAAIETTLNGATPDGKVVIESGNVTANAGLDAAAIGGNTTKSAGTITISGGVVHASGSTKSGGSGGAGIGGGSDGSGGTITISGTATVYALGGANYDGVYGAAGIGGGNGGTGGTITISGGTVTAVGNGGHDTATSGAGIGGGDEGQPGTILISGGNIHARGTASAAESVPGLNSTQTAILAQSRYREAPSQQQVGHMERESVAGTPHISVPYR